MMFSKYETLKKLDNVVISRCEFDNVIVWNTDKGNVKKLKKIKPVTQKYEWQGEMAKIDEEKSKKE